MNTKHLLNGFLYACLLLIFSTTLVSGQGLEATPLGTAFTYQGRLLNSGTPYTGNCDFHFGLYDTENLGTLVGETSALSLPVAEGYFSVPLDFGSGKFSGDNRWLEIQVRCPAGSGTYEQLTPRQALTAAPYALYAPNSGLAQNALAADAVPWSGISNRPAGLDDGDNDTTYTAGTGLSLISGTFEVNPAYVQRRVSTACDSGSAIRAIAENGSVTCESTAYVGGDITSVIAGTGLSGGGDFGDVVLQANATYLQRRVNTACTVGSAIRSIAQDGSVTCETFTPAGWSLAGNSGTTAGTNYLGTSDNTALELKVNGQRALRIEPYPSGPNMIGGSSDNFVAIDVVNATIAGGGSPTIPNSVTGNSGTVSGGVGNEAGSGATVAGGEYNASSAYSSIGGGYDNTANGLYSAIGGGQYNHASASYTTIAGGGPSDPADPTTNNRATDKYCTIGGGANNQAGNANETLDDVLYSTVSGGANNVASGDTATIAGGYDNHAEGLQSFVGGGTLNLASGLTTVVAGGTGNQATGETSSVGGGNNNTASAFVATISGGVNNLASGNNSFIGAGSGNVADKAGSTVAGGYSNDATGISAVVSGGDTNTASGDLSSVGGGASNSATATYSTVGAGQGNTASGYGSQIAGGYSNSASGNASTVSGGWANSALGYGAIVPGGAYNNAIGDYSFAAGYGTSAGNDGCFVWADTSSDTEVECVNDNRWVARAAGGVYFYTNSTKTSGMYLSAGGSGWNTVSNKALKENFNTIDTKQLLANLAEHPVTTWNYKSQDETIKHVGLMADEFNSLLAGLGGEGAEYINSMDAVGVALAAAQGLYAENKDLFAENKDLKAELSTQKGQIENLETRLAALESQPMEQKTTPVMFALLGGMGMLSLAGLWLSRRKNGGS